MIPFLLKAPPPLERCANVCTIETLVWVSPRSLSYHVMISMVLKEIWKRQIPVCRNTQIGNEIDAHQCSGASASVRGAQAPSGPTDLTGEKRQYCTKSEQEWW